eukprot:3173462-Rhodomonas_salina.1
MVWGWIVRRIEEENEDVLFAAAAVSEGDRRREEREGAVGAGMECGLTAEDHAEVARALVEAGADKEAKDTVRRKKAGCTMRGAGWGLVRTAETEGGGGSGGVQGEGEGTSVAGRSGRAGMVRRRRLSRSQQEKEDGWDGAGEVSGDARRLDVQEGGGDGAGMERDLTAAGAMAGRGQAAALCHFFGECGGSEGAGGVGCGQGGEE